MAVDISYVAELDKVSRKEKIDCGEEFRKAVSIRERIIRNIEKPIPIGALLFQPDNKHGISRVVSIGLKEVFQLCQFVLQFPSRLFLCLTRLLAALFLTLFILLLGPICTIVISFKKLAVLAETVMLFHKFARQLTGVNQIVATAHYLDTFYFNMLIS